MLLKDRIFGLDLLRASAVLLVVFHHSLAFMMAPAWLNVFGGLGEIGVGSLLVLSGYLIGLGLMKRSRAGRFTRMADLGEFYGRRLMRTLPPYYFFLLMMAALFPPVMQTLWSHKEYFFFLQNFAWATAPFYVQTWTLTVLEFFYLLFPLLLFLTSKFTRNYLLCLAVPMAVLFFVPMTFRALHTQLDTSTEESFRIWVIYRLDTPIIGVAAALIQLEMPSLWTWFLRRSWIGLCTFAAIVIYHLLDCPGLYPNHAWQVVFYPISALAMAPLLPFLCSWKRNANAFGIVMSTISQSSYTLYVSHYFALSIGFCCLAFLGIAHDQWLIEFPIYLAVIALVTWPSYYLVEEPFIRLRENPAPSLFSLLANFGVRARRALWEKRLAGEVSATSAQTE